MLLEEERDGAFRRESILRKQLVMAQARIADLHRSLLLLRGVGSSPLKAPKPSGE